MSEITSKCPALQIADELAAGSTPASEYQFMAAFADATADWAMQAGIKFEKYSNSVAISDTKSVKPAQVVRNLHRMAKMLQQISRNVLASREQQALRHELVDCLLLLETRFTQIQEGDKKPATPVSEKKENRVSKPSSPTPPPEDEATPHKSTTQEENGFFVLSSQDNARPAEVDSSPPAKPPPQSEYSDPVEIPAPVTPEEMAKEESAKLQAPDSATPTSPSIPLPNIEIEQDWDADLIGSATDTDASQDEIALPASISAEAVPNDFEMEVPALVPPEPDEPAPAAELPLPEIHIEEDWDAGIADSSEAAASDQGEITLPTSIASELAADAVPPIADELSLPTTSTETLAVPAMEETPDFAGLNEIDDLALPNLGDMASEPASEENNALADKPEDADPEPDDLGGDILSNWQPEPESTPTPPPSPPPVQAKPKPTPTPASVATTQAKKGATPVKKSKRRKLTEVELMIVELSRIYREAFPGIDKVTRH